MSNCAPRWRSCRDSQVTAVTAKPIYFYALAAAARAAAQRFLVASMILCRPCALGFRFGFLAAGLAVLAAAPGSLLAEAHLFRRASAIRCLAVALIVRRLRIGSSAAEGSVFPPVISCPKHR